MSTMTSEGRSSPFSRVGDAGTRNMFPPVRWLEFQQTDEEAGMGGIEEIGLDDDVRSDFSVIPFGGSENDVSPPDLRHRRP